MHNGLRGLRKAALVCCWTIIFVQHVVPTAHVSATVTETTHQEKAAKLSHRAPPRGDVRRSPGQSCRWTFSMLPLRISPVDTHFSARRGSGTELRETLGEGWQSTKSRVASGDTKPDRRLKRETADPHLKHDAFNQMDILIATPTICRPF